MKAERIATNVCATMSQTSTGERMARARRAKPAAVCSVVFATMVWSASAAAQSVVYNVWETWEGSLIPDSQSTSGEELVKVINGITLSPDTAWFIEGGFGGWTSMERTFQPPAGLDCTAFAAVAPGSHVATDVRLGVIDKPSWTYEVTNDFVIDDPEVHTFGQYYWKSASWTSNGNQIVLRVLVYGIPGGAHVYADDFVVQCTD